MTDERYAELKERARTHGLAPIEAMQLCDEIDRQASQIRELTRMRDNDKPPMASYSYLNSRAERLRAEGGRV